MEEGLHYTLSIGQGPIRNQGIISLIVVVGSEERLGTEITTINSNNVPMCLIKPLQNPIIEDTSTTTITPREVIWDTIVDVICMG